MREVMMEKTTNFIGDMRQCSTMMIRPTYYRKGAQGAQIVS